MNVQTDRNNLYVPVPLEADYAIGLCTVAIVLLVAAFYYSGIRRDALTANPLRLLLAIVAAATRQSESKFWLVWFLMGLAIVLLFTSAVIAIGLIITNS